MILKFAIDNGFDLKISCPCTKCGNFWEIKKVNMKSHFSSYEIDMSYEKWFGETPLSKGSSRKRVRIEKVCDKNEDDHLTDMFNDAENYFVDHSDKLNKMLEDAEKSIYPSSNITKFSLLVRVYN